MTKTSKASSTLLASLISRYPLLLNLESAILLAVELICNTYRSGGKVLICGNGGSAADSDHIVAELMKSLKVKRSIPDEDREILRMSKVADADKLTDKLERGVAAVALPSQISLVTAILNDTDPDMIFAQQVYVLGRKGDVLIGISTQGKARDVIAALKVGRAFGLATIGLTGSAPSPLKELCDVLIGVPAVETAQVQELHLPVYHAICEMVEVELFGE
jgi:D-sedoheptulose 7-phosphate isomerase